MIHVTTLLLKSQYDTYAPQIALLKHLPTTQKLNMTLIPSNPNPLIPSPSKNLK